MDRERWEYRTVRVAFGTKSAMEESVGWLNGLGAEGWEAVTAMGTEQGGRVILKRPAGPDGPEPQPSVYR